MLKKQNRLDVVQSGNMEITSSPLLVIKFSKNNLAFNRFAFVISKKIDKRAVVRNSLKRKLSLSIEEIFDNIVSGYDFILYPKKDIITCSPEEVKTQLVRALEVKNLLK
jgi:ribonuclease P protein component